MNVWFSGNRSGCDYEGSRQCATRSEKEMRAHIDEAENRDIVLNQIPRDCRVRKPYAFEVEVELVRVLVDVVRDIWHD